jgi:type II secretory pathway pseudopilin PulG
MILPTNTLRLTAIGQRLRSTRGFTLLEIMFVGGCAAIVLAAILTGYTYLLRAFAAVQNYSDIHQMAGSTVAVFTKDMREVSGVSSISSNSSIQVTIPTGFAWNGSITGTKTVTYTYTNSALYRTDSAIGGAKLQATNVYNLVFTLYNNSGVALASNTTTGCKGVQMDLYLRKYVGSNANTEEYRSARVAMRNLP